MKGNQWVLTKIVNFWSRITIYFMLLVYKNLNDNIYVSFIKGKLTKKNIGSFYLSSEEDNTLIILTK